MSFTFIQLFLDSILFLHTSSYLMMMIRLTIVCPSVLQTTARCYPLPKANDKTLEVKESFD
jgi:hypothetical protein